MFLIVGGTHYTFPGRHLYLAPKKLPYNYPSLESLVKLHCRVEKTKDPGDHRPTMPK